MWMEDTNAGIVWEGGKEVKIPKLSMDGLGTMQGYTAPQGDLTLEWETKRLQYYRGRNFSIGRYDVDETNFALSVGNALKVFLNGQVIPEVDCLRIAAAAQGAVSFGTVVPQATGSLTAANILDALMADIGKVQDKIGETEQLYIQISTSLKNLLERSSQIQRYLNVRDFSIRSATMKIEALNDQYLIGTPSAYMHSVFGLNDGRTGGQTVGGVTFANLGANVNWIIAARPSVDAIARPQVSKVIDPDTNQDGEYWKVMFSIYHGLWVMENKGDGLLVNLDTTPGTLSVSTVAGTVADGDSVVTVVGVKPEGFKYMYKCASGTAPAVAIGTKLTASDGWADLPADGLINTTNGYKITVSLTAPNGQPIASGSGDVAAKT
jgi:rRNA processing protein Gar1